MLRRDLQVINHLRWAAGGDGRDKHLLAEKSAKLFARQDYCSRDEMLSVAAPDRMIRRYTDLLALPIRGFDRERNDIFVIADSITQFKIKFAICSF